MLLEDAVSSVTNKNRFSGSMARPTGATEVTKGEPLICVRAPLVLLMEYTETSPDPAFAEYRNFPAGSITTVCGVVPAAKGEPATGVGKPVLGSSAKAEMLLLPELAVYKTLSVGCKVEPRGARRDEVLGIDAV